MPYFVDVAAVRIQSWLSRTPSLRGRRGASALLSVATSAEEVTPLLPTHCRMNDEAGDVDGVVSLAADTEEAAGAGSHAVAKHLRHQMPAIELVVTPVVESADYVSAYRDLHTGPNCTWQPPVPEITFALPCSYCGHDPATRTGDLSPDRRDQPICSDCDRRLAHAGFASAASGSRLPRDQVRVLEWLGFPDDLPADFPPDFESLSGMDRESTHVATVFCDGNRIGTLFEALASSGKLSKRDLAAGIDAATTTSLATAIRHISRDGDRYLPISVHLVGGDDLLVSVPAHRGWDFTLQYLKSFGQALDGWRQSAGVTSGVAPTASAGLVVHHYSYPFPLVVETAEHALTAAKKSLHGKDAAVAWADITAEDVTVHGPRELAWFDTWAGALDELGSVPASQRAVLARLSDAEIPDQVRRQGLEAAKQLFEEHPSALRNGLSIVKWRRAGE